MARKNHNFEVSYIEIILRNIKIAGFSATGRVCFGIAIGLSNLGAEYLARKR